MQDEAESLVIFVRAKVYSRNYDLQVVMNFQELGLDPLSWIRSILVLMAEASKVKRVHDAALSQFIRALKVGNENEKFCRIKLLPIEELTHQNVREMFLLLEEEIKKTQSTNLSKYKLSQEFRGFLLEYLQCLDGKSDFHRHSVGFKTGLSSSKQPRKMISDFGVANTSDDPEEPLGALKLDDVNGLHYRVHQKLEADLNKIINACTNELAWHKSARGYLSRCRNVEPTSNEMSLIRKALRFKNSRINLKRAGVYRIKVETVIAAVLRIIDEDRLCYADRKYSPIFEWFAIEVRGVLKQFNLEISTIRFFMLEYRLEAMELRAICNMLLCYTGWNVGALIDMERRSIVKEGDGYVMQGYKSKTGDYTPPFYIDKYYPHGKAAIDLLLWNRDQLIKLRLLDETNPNLWFSWMPTFGIHDKQSIGIFVGNESFIDRHNLPRYSFEQIRTQVMSRDILVSNGNVDEVRRNFGHKSALTTGDYLQQIIFHRLASVVNLDFQRKLEATIVWRLREECNEAAYDSKVDTSRRIHLIPIGDGASCKSPSDAPAEFELVNGLCRAEHCHFNDGCQNRVIEINRESLRALVRKRKFYLGSWKRLYLANKQRFELVHGPAFLFNLALYDFIKNSSYSGFLREAEKELS